MSTLEVSLPPTLRSALTEKKVWNDQGQSVELHSNVAESEAADLYRVVRELKPEATLEVGFAQGVSAQAILAALEANGKGHHHVMDPYQDRFENCGLTMVKRAGLERWMTFYPKFAEEVIPTLPEIGFAFIDASHLFDLTLSEFVLTDKKLKVGGVVAFHDMWMPSQQAFIRYVLSNRSYQVYRPQATAQHDAGSNGSDDATWKRAIRAACSLIPGSERIFAPSFLKPWNSLNIPNLVFLQKTGEDSRDWRFHQNF
jgi:predicted O-methyltransferase YrrM